MRRSWAWLGGILLLCGWTGGARANDPESPLPYTADNHLVFDAGFYGFRPQFNNNPAHFLTRNAGGVPQDTRVIGFDNNFEYGPQVHLGYVDMSGLGVQARYWSFDQSTQANFSSTQPDAATTFTISSAAPLGVGFASGTTLGLPNNFLFVSNLRLNVVDVEAAQEIEFGPWLLTLGGGLRYAHLGQGYDATQIRTTGTSGGLTYLADTSTLISRTDFDGIGPLIGLESRRRLGDSPLSLFGMARGTVLFGDTNQAASVNTFTQTKVGAGPITTVSTTRTASNSTNDLLPTAEAEVGLEFDHILGRVRLFVQTSLVGQAWLGGGNASKAGTGGTGGPPGYGTGAVTESNFGFIGLSFRGGIMF